MKSRESRHKVLVRARMTCGRDWQDVCILNYSVHGLGLACDAPPPRGSYLEVRRGPFVIVARVAWSKGHRFGARTQDAVGHVAIMGKVAPEAWDGEAARPVERRAAARMTSVKQARERGRAAEFAGIALAVAAAAGLVAEAAYARLSAPMERVRSALSGR